MTREIYLAGGCFWGTEHFFKLIYGVIDTQVGYANGTVENPSYEQVCTHKTGHAETVRVVYDPEKIGLEFLLDMFFTAIDPTLEDQQGHDVGQASTTLTPPTCPSSSSAWLPRRSATSSPSSPRCCRCSASTPPRSTTRTTSTRTPTATATCHWASSSSPAAPSHRDKTIQH